MSAKENSLETFNSKINKILVISDTHQNCYSDIDNEIKKQILIADLVIHCGDITSHDVINGIKENAKKTLIVHGNSDPPNVRGNIPSKIVFKIEKYIFGIIHPYWGGPPPLDFDLILEEFQGYKLDFVLFGHTHDAHIEEYKGITFINPGQGYSEFVVPMSFCLIEIKQSKISISINKIST